MGMTKLKADFKIVTPLFMSGANPQSAELQVPSIKGVLRFWWRALALGRLGSVEGVRAEEARIFGSTKGQSSVKLRLSPPKKISRLKKKSVLKYNGIGDVVGEGARYLGYGILDVSGELTRQCIGYPLEGGELELLFRSKTLEDDIKSVEAALIAMSLFGGLGSRSRKGYGSINLTNLTRNDETEPVFTMPNDLDGLNGAISCLFDINGRYKIEPYHGLPPYTAFSEMTRIDIIDEGDEPLKLLNSVGEKMMEYRSYRKGRNFLGDYRLIRDALTKNVTDHPERAIFGLPHNYFFSSTHDSAEVKPKDYKRRASPLFIHIQQLNKDQYAAIAAIFPADFLPKEEKIMVEMSPVDVNVDYKVLNDFIDGNGMPRFASQVRVI